jgi:hypothetical protein
MEDFGARSSTTRAQLLDGAPVEIGRGFEKRGGVSQTVVMGMLERSGRIKTKVLGEQNCKVLRAEILANVEEGANVITDK